MGELFCCITSLTVGICWVTFKPSTAGEELLDHPSAVLNFQWQMPGTAFKTAKVVKSG
jgi:hypothetical protein